MEYRLQNVKEAFLLFYEKNVSVFSIYAYTSTKICPQNIMNNNGIVKPLAMYVTDGVPYWVFHFFPYFGLPITDYTCGAPHGYQVDDSRVNGIACTHVVLGVKMIIIVTSLMRFVSATWLHYVTSFFSVA